MRCAQDGAPWCWASDRLRVRVRVRVTVRVRVHLNTNPNPGAPWCWAKHDCEQFANPCPDLDVGWYHGSATHMPTGSFPPDSNAHEGWCSGDWTLGMVSDQVRIPADLPPGRYVLSWRLDCEETAQVWSNCADVNIVPKRHAPVEET